MKVVIVAGGKGTRISSVISAIPKPMIPINGTPVLELEILSLKQQGFHDFIITISHLANVIMDYFGDGSKIGVNITYFYEMTPLGNAGALFKIKDQLKDDFLLINADAIFDIDFKRFIDFHKEKHALVTLLVHPNSHPYDSGLIITNSNNEVINWLAKEDKRPLWYKNLVNAGVHIISPKILDICIETEKVDLDRHLLQPLCGTGKMFAYQSSEYVKDMGTPERLKMVTEDFKKNLITNRNLANKQKAIFLDRDGTINKYVGFLTDINKFELLDNVASAVKKINESGYLAIVVSNQPVIARGELTFEQLQEIHNKMETLLGNEGAYLDAIYFCPHHPDAGFPGERIEYKIECNCRKPKPGMLLKASLDFNIDLSNSWVIGDSISDIEAGRKAGCKCILLCETKRGGILTKKIS